MRKPRFTLRELMVALVIVACVFSLYYQDVRRKAETREAARRPAEFPARSGRILLRAVLPSEFRLDEGARAGCTIVNDSEAPIEFSRPPDALVTVVLDEHGQEPPPAPDSWRPPAGPSGPPSPPPSPEIVLSGDGIVDFEGWRPEEHYRLAPGWYTLEWRFRCGLQPEGREVRSIPKTFRVLPPTRPLTGRMVLALGLVEGRRFEAGELIPLDWTLRNETEEPVTIRQGAAHIDLVVRDESGREMPLTAEGRRLRDAFLEGPEDPEERPERMNPGKATESAQGNGLSVRYDLPPGRYTAELTYRERPGSPADEVRSAPTRFEVVPRSGPRPRRNDELVGPPAPPSYRDPATGMRFRVESDGQTVVATMPDGAERWRRDPFLGAALPSGRRGRPVIRYLGPTREEHAERMRARGLSGPFLGISFGKSRFGVLDGGTGEFLFLGQD